MTDKSKKIPPMPTALSGFQIEASRTYGGIKVTVGGVVGIKDFSDEQITLGAHSGKIIINGKMLRLTVYEGGTVDIVGRVEGIGLEYGKA